MSNVLNFVKEVLIEELENYESESIYGCDLAFTLLEKYNVDGSYTYSTYESIQWIQENFTSIAEFIEEFDPESNGISLNNPFTDPEIFQVQIMLYASDQIMSKSQYVNDNWNNEIELTQEVINIITNELNNISEL